MMNKKKRNINLLVLLIGISITLGTIFILNRNNDVKKLSQLDNNDGKILFAQLPISYSAVTQYAQIKDLYEKEELDYLSKSVPAGPDVVVALGSISDNSPDGGSIAITPVISMIGAKKHPIILATTLTSNHRVRLVTFEKNGISDNPNTLRGKKIGVVKNTVGDIYLSRLLQKGGLTENDILIVDGKPGHLRNLLLNGEIEGAILWDPYVTESVRLYKAGVEKNELTERGDPKVLLDSTLYTLAFNIVTTKEKLTKNRDDFKKMLEAVVKAGDMIEENPKEAQKLFEQWLNLEENDLKNFIETTDFSVYLDIQKTKEWMNNELKWLKGLRSDTYVPDDLTPYIDASILREIDKSRVQE